MQIIIILLSTKSKAIMMKFRSIDLRKVALTFLICVIYGLTAIAAPIISSFTPTFGNIGTSVTITGTNFNSTAANNIVFFGAVKATVTAATATSLTVTVPAGATCQPISVTDLNTGLSAYSVKYFNTTFTGVNGIDAGSFANNVDYVSSTTPYCISVGDLDGDGKSDIAIANFGSANISIFHNTSSAGTITFATKVDYLTNISPISITIGDLDGDGKPDLVVANYGSSNISIFRNTSTLGVLTLASKVDFTANTQPRNIGIGDFDGDGKMDLAVVDYGIEEVSILHNKSTIGSIAFDPKIDLETDSKPYGISVGDLDGDGKPDFIVTSAYSNCVSVYHNKSTSGTLLFETKVNFGTGGSPVNSAIGDLDGDGKPDIIVTNSSENSISILRNTSSVGTISLAKKIDLTTGNFPMSVSVGDLDGDGKPELAVANYTSNSVSLFHNISTVGAISYDLALNYTTSVPRGVSISDLDGDGKADLAIAGNTSTFSVFKNLGIPPVITSFSPVSGTIGTSITITGTNLLGTSAVSFGSNPASSFNIISPTTITAIVNIGTPAVVSDVNLTAPRGTSVKTGFTFVLPPPPTITSFLPVSASIGTTITITGTNFLGPTTVNIGGISATSKVVSPTTITAIVPQCTSGNISVTTMGGMISNPGFILIPLSTITTFTPTSGPTGTTVTITGANFNTAINNNIVFFGATKAIVTAATATTLSVTVPVGATFQQISVTDLITGLTAFSQKPFIVTYNEGSSFNTGSFDDNIDFAAGSQPYSVALGDLDGDGLSDIVVSNYASDNISVYRNTTVNGIISFTQKSDYSVGLESINVVISDLNGDGKQDLVVVNYMSNTISILKNISTVGTIAFAPKIDYNVGTSPRNAAIGDLDGDNRPDIVVSNVGSGNVSILRNTSNLSTLSFESKVDLNANTNPYSVSIGDIDGDGKPEIAVANFGSGNISVYRNKCTAGMLSFDLKKDFTSGTAPVSNPLGDLDGDGKLDMIVINYSQSSISILRNTSSIGTISFSAKADFTTSNNCMHAAIADIDGDGKLDIAVAEYATSKITLFRNTTINSTITFDPSVKYTCAGPRGLAIGDLDGDGRPDLAASSDTKNISCFKNINIAPILTDFTPKSGTNGSIITISGVFLKGTTGVDFGGVAATSFKYVSSNTITAVVGAGLTGDVVVVNPKGDAHISGFTYTEPVPPTISSFSPTVAIEGTMVTITGTDFVGVSVVNFGGVSAKSIIVNSSTSITAIVGSGASGDVSLTTPGGTVALAGFTFIPPAVISSFTPTTCKSGTTVVITGTNFTGATDVSFGGIPANSYTIDSPTSITAITPVGLSGNVSVTTIAGTASITGYIFIPAPTITSFTPESAKGGSTITITGTNFTDASNVSFGNVAAKSFVVVSSTSITAVIDAGESGNISVTTPGGTVSKDGFNFIPLPTITSFTPTSGGNGTIISITGTNLLGTSSVKFGGTSVNSFTILSSTNITASVSIGTSGSVEITTGGGTVSLDGFIFIDPPTITSFTPTTGLSETIVTITGTNFTNATEVNFGGTKAKSFTVDSPTSITAIVDNGSSGNINVTTVGGKASFVGFIFTGPPTIKSFDPTNAGNGLMITIYGAGLTGATSVTIGNVSAISFTVISGTIITATIGKSSSGTVIVTTPNGTATLDGFVFVATPTISSFTPTTGVKDATVLIKGNAFTGAKQVSFGDSLAKSFIVVSDTLISAIVARGTSGDVSITTPGGKATLAGFKYLDTDVKDIKESGIIIYPNPVVDYLYFKIPDTNPMDVQIFDINGRIVMHSKMTNQRLDLQNLKAGMYTLKIGIANYKIIKQ